MELNSKFIRDYEKMCENINETYENIIEYYIRDDIQPKIEKHFSQIKKNYLNSSRNINWNESYVYLISDNDLEKFNSHYNNCKEKRRVVSVSGDYFEKVCKKLKKIYPKWTTKAPRGYKDSPPNDMEIIYLSP